MRWYTMILLRTLQVEGNRNIHFWLWLQSPLKYVVRHDNTNESLHFLFEVQIMTIYGLFVGSATTRPAPTNPMQYEIVRHG